MNNHIPLVKPFLPPHNEYSKMLEKIWDNRILSNRGPYHNQFMSKVSNFLDVGYAYPFVNGTIALETAIKVLNLKDTEIITTPFTYVATTLSIINTGNTPIFADVNNYDGNIDPLSIEELITPKTSAILAVHIYGQPCDIESIEEIAKKHNLYVIYDSAQAFGVKFKGKGIANYGDINIFSMHATKTFNTIEGGLICSNNPDMNRIVHLSCNFGLAENYDLIYPGSNGKFNEFQAAMGLLQLKYVNKVIEKRKQLVEEYKKHLPDYLIYTRYDREDTEYNYTYFVIIHPERDEIMNELMRKNISSRTYFSPLVSESTLVKRDFKPFVLDPYSELENAKSVAKDVLVIPLYYDMELKDVKRVSDVINKTLS